MAWSLIAKSTRNEIRHKHSLLADKEIDLALAERRREFDRAVQSGFLPTVTLTVVID